MAAFLDALGLSEFDISDREPGPDPIRSAGATMLRDEDPATFRRVNMATAQWLGARNEIAAALRHAQLAEEWDTVAALLTDNWDALLAEQSDLVRQSLRPSLRTCSETMPGSWWHGTTFSTSPRRAAPGRHSSLVCSFLTAQPSRVAAAGSRYGRC